MSRRRALGIFIAAWVVRLIYVAQIRAAPYFDVPLVDGANYFRTAAAIAAGDLLGGPGVFWQPPLYPYFLSLLLAIFGPRMEWIYAVQTAIGSLSCVLVYDIARRLFDARTAVAAAAVMVLYGPLIHFDAQPLIPVLHIALVLAGLLLMLRAAGVGAAGVQRPERGERCDWALAGLSWGLAAIATPNILLAAPLAAAWARRRARAAGPAVILLVCGVAAPVALVALRNVAVAGQLVLISSNGGINFYIGNNPDYDRTIRIRPGGEFERLSRAPENLGIIGGPAESGYFTRRALEFIGQYPRQALRLYLRKTIDLIAGREIPRNQDAYLYRSYSSLLALLLWRFGVAFPFGVVAPLALAGALASFTDRAPDGDGGQRQGRALLLCYGAAYAVSILLFFPTDRYRLPLVPVLAIFAGHLLASPRATWRRPAILAALLAGVVLFNLDARKPAQTYPEEEALNRAYALRMKGRLDEARQEYRRAIVLNPRRIDPYNALATMAAQEGSWEEAAARYRDLLEIAPDFVEVRRDLGQAYAALGRREEARREWKIAIHLAPGAGMALTDLCMSYFEEGALLAAEPYCERAVGVRPDLPDPHLALARVARALGRTDLALAEAGEAARLFPRGSPGRQRAERILRKLSERAPAEAGPDTGGSGD
jgi:Flp pilus assembly protein TadD